MKILAIETSCDETAIAIVEAGGVLKAPRFKISKNLVSSQIAIHRPFGGVVPNLAKREHIKNLPIILGKIFGIYKSEFLVPKQIPKFKIQNIDIVAVTVGPGLEPALWTGVNFAKEICKQFKIQNSKIKIIGVNHLEGHLYSFLLSKNYNLKPITYNLFPAIALIVSGGHTILVLMKSLTDWRKIGETRDDAVGEAFDKVARMLELPYPGGPEVERLAVKGDPNVIPFPRPMMNSKDYDFSFSGLKTSVLYYLRDNLKAKKEDVAASFQKAAIDVLVAKTMRAVREFGAKSVILSGGVAANKCLRKELKVASDKLSVNFLSADKKFQTDNAVIIAVAAYIQFLRKKKRVIRAQANLNL
ncbi:MAG TPA: tRNA (adenosine(37)-N6)-threonylcarbamoyltransferase complex transferase subunit TsaD [Candidatus Paceibacterota bacterium]|nr:tRNA (adenosine(37)-N6)-threonylcarbamoyltransferase complex transferase subunit TsaD [Candidatus Paceibacterota bacterium]